MICPRCGQSLPPGTSVPADAPARGAGGFSSADATVLSVGSLGDTDATRLGLERGPFDPDATRLGIGLPPVDPNATRLGVAPPPIDPDATRLGFGPPPGLAAAGAGAAAARTAFDPAMTLPAYTPGLHPMEAPSAAEQASRDADPAQALVGKPLGRRYRIQKLLGAGGMGAVYAAWDRELAIAVALKTVRPEVAADPETARALEQRFKQELLLARQVTHKNIVRVYDMGEVDGIKYITMPYSPAPISPASWMRKASSRCAPCCASRGRSPRASPPRTKPGSSIAI